MNFKVIPRRTGLYFLWDPPEGSIAILSYTITCYISSDLAINVTLNPVNSITLDEFMPHTTYTCSMYGSSSGGNGPMTNRVNITTEGLQSLLSELQVLYARCPTDDMGDVYLPFISLDTLYGVDQVFLERQDDGTSQEISIGNTNGFPFGASNQTRLYVSKNRIV